MIKKLCKNKAFIAFILCGLLGTLIILPNIIINKGIYSLTADFNYQQIPFNKLMNYSIKNGEIFWTWYNELGSNFIATFSFYNLFSPFNMIGYIFPESIYEYLIGPIFILKYAVSGFTSYLFLKRYVKNKNYCIIGSLLYTFSGFQLTNILFYHFHDVVAFFPLLLYSLDNLMYDNKKGHFTLYVALCAFTNWFFFIGECVFLLIYFIIKVLTKEYKITVKKFLLVTLEALLGCSLAALVLIPSALFTLGNTRLNNNWDFISMIKYPFIKILEILRGFIFPSEAMNVRAVLNKYNYRSVELYLPVVGSVLALSYFFKNKKNWLSILMFTLCIFMVVPILNSSFILFQNNYYARWFFMPTLILSLMSIKCLEEKIELKKGFILTITASFIFYLGLFYLSTKIKVIYNKPYFIMTIIFMLINLLMLFIINKRNKQKEKLLILAIFIFVTIWGNYNIYYYKDRHIKTNDSYFTYLKSNDYISFESNTRTNSAKSCEVNYGYILKINNIKVFNSNINSSAFEFYKSLDLKRTIKTKINEKDINDLLGVKYILSCNNEDLSALGYKLIKEKGPYKIYKNNDYLPFGFPINEFISNEDFNNLPKEEKIKTLKTKAVLTEQQLKNHMSLTDKHPKYLSNDFKFTKNGFTSIINTTDETLAIYQIPFDKGWTGKINGKNIDIEKVDNGLIGIKLNKGLNKIELTYVPSGLKIGIIISTLSLIALIIYCIINKKSFFKYMKMMRKKVKRCTF